MLRTDIAVTALGRYDGGGFNDPAGSGGHIVCRQSVRATATLYKAALISLAEMLTAEEDPTYTVWSKDVTLKFSESTVSKEEIIRSLLRMGFVFTGEM